MRARSLTSNGKAKSEAALYADAEVLQAQQAARVAGQRFGAQRPVLRERVASVERKLALVLELAAVLHPHPQAAAIAQRVSPLHALSRGKADCLTPVMQGGAEAVIV